MPQYETIPSSASTAVRQSCQHPDQELRRRTYSDGRLHYVFQCLTCGSQVRSIKHAEALQAGGAEAPLWDAGLSDRYWQGHIAERQEVWHEQRSAWQQNYDAYLLSDDWRAKRAQRLRFDQYQCQARLDDCQTRATEVHHLSYRHLGNEPMFDLVSVCGPCHRAITAMDRRLTPGGDE